jgi:hypothetical protein
VTRAKAVTTPIRRGLVASSKLHPSVKDGVQALKKADRALIEEAVRTAFVDSIDIDEAFRSGHDTENRWDYLLGHEESGKIVALEPHTANNKAVSVVIKKREASLRQLRDDLKPGVFVAEWFWVASGKVDFTPLDKQITRLNENGIRFVGKAFLRKWLPKPPSAK